MNSHFPAASSTAGRVLTWENWASCGIDTLSFHVDALLMKPGIAVLRRFASLSAFTGWHARHVLHVRIAPPDKHDRIVIRSALDGSVQYWESAALCAVMDHLAPDGLILPDWFQDIWRTHATRQSLVLYPASAEDNRPVEDACRGVCYASEAAWQVLDTAYAEVFTPLAPDCSCPACLSGVTRAYMHHLYQHTPLLAQRYLAMHNLCTRTYDKLPISSL